MDNRFPLALSLGTNVKGYIINDVIGQGGFGITYLVYDTQAKKTVVLKEYFPSNIALRNEGMVISNSAASENDFMHGKKTFLQEAQNLGRFKHEAIVKVFGYFEANGTAYMVMELVHGETLAHKINGLVAVKKTMSEKEIMIWLTSVMNGLDCVHRGGFMHRDIKPGNIIISHETGKGCLIDFGAARHDVGGKTKSLSVILTPGFAPIEQYSSDGKGQGTWTDIYALGATVWCAMTGNAPADAPDRSAEIMYHHPDPVHLYRDKLVNTGYSRRFVDTVIAMLEVNSQDRPRTISDIKAMLGLALMSQEDFIKSIKISEKPKSKIRKLLFGKYLDKKKVVVIAVLLFIVMLISILYQYTELLDSFKSSDALFQKGMKYYYSFDSKRDDTLAIKYLIKAAERENAQAQYQLGLSYGVGHGVPKNPQLAVEWYKKAAIQGNAEAQSLLADHYEKGEGLQKDDRKAIYWYTKAAEQGDAEALFELSKRFYRGIGLSKDKKKAIELFIKAAEAGEPIADVYYKNHPEEVKKGNLCFDELKILHEIESNSY